MIGVIYGKKDSLMRIIFELLTALFGVVLLTYCFFYVGVGFSINVWEYFLNGMKALFLEKKVFMYFVSQALYFIGIYFASKRKFAFATISDYSKEIITSVLFITYGVSIIGEIVNSFLVVLVIISILTYMGIIIIFLIRLSLQIYKLNEKNSQFYIYKILYTYKIQSLVVILVISSQLIILIYAFIYFKFNMLLPENAINAGLKQDSKILKSFISIYYFSSVTFFTVGYGDILPYGNNLRLLATSEMIVGFIVNLLYVPVLFTFIMDLFNGKKKEEQKPKGSFIEPLNMTELHCIPCFSFQDIKSLKHQNFDHSGIRFEPLALSLIKDINIKQLINLFYVDIVDDSLSMLNIYNGDKLLILRQENLTINDLGMFFLDNDSRKIIFGNVIQGFRGKQPIKCVKAYWNNCIIHSETILQIGKVIYIKRKQ